MEELLGGGALRRLTSHTSIFLDFHSRHVRRSRKLDEHL